MGPSPQSKLECNLLSRSSTRNLQRAAEGSSPPRLRETILLHGCPDGQCAPSTVRRSPYWKKHSSWPVRDHSPRRPANGQDLCLVGGRRCLETFGRRVARDDENKYPGASFAPVPAPLWLPDCRPNAKRKSKNISSQETQGESEQVAVEEGSQPMKACSQILPTSLPLQGRRRDRLVVDWCQSLHSDQTQLDWSRGPRK